MQSRDERLVAKDAGVREVSFTVRLAAWMPLLIFLYFAGHAIFRAGVSAYLERDEAEFVGAVGFQLGFENSHPPLYNWLLTAALLLTAGKWASAMAIVKNALLAATYLLGFDTMRRLTGRSAGGLVLVAAFLLLPQIVWKSQITLAHSVLVLFGTVATLHAIVLCIRNGSILAFAWLGVALSAGLLAKYNFFFTLASLAIAVCWVPEVRTGLLRARLLVSGLVIVLLTGPHFVWALTHWQATTRRLSKLDQEITGFTLPIDIPVLGLDGAFSVFVGSAASIGLLVAVIAVAARRSRLRRDPALADPSGVAAFARFLWIWGVAGLLGLTAFIVLGDFHSIQERYLTPVLLPFVYWLCLRSRVSARTGATAFVALAGLTVAVIATSLLAGLTLFGRDQLMFPYRAIAEELTKETAGASAMTGVTAFYSRQEKYAANLALRFPGLEIWRGQPGVKRVLVLLPKREPLSPAGGQLMEFEQLFRPAGPSVDISAIYENWSGATAGVTAQVYERR